MDEDAEKLVALARAGCPSLGTWSKGGIMELMILVAVVLALAVVAAVRGDAVEAARKTESLRRVAAERQSAAAERAAAAVADADRIASLNHDCHVMVKGYCDQSSRRQAAEDALTQAIANAHDAALQARFDAAAAARTAAAAADAVAKEAAVKAALEAFSLTVMWGQTLDEERARADAAEAALAQAKAELRNAANLAAVRGCALGNRRK